MQRTTTCIYFSISGGYTLVRTMNIQFVVSHWVNLTCPAKDLEKKRKKDERNIVGKGKTRSKSVIQVNYLASWENPQMTG